MCYQIVQINFDVQAIPDDILSDPENKTDADYGTRAIHPFSFPAEFLAEVAVEQMFADYERVLSGDNSYTDAEKAAIEMAFEYPIGLVEIHTGELTLYRDAPRPNLQAFETSDLTKLTYGLADLRIADPEYGKGIVRVTDRLTASFALSMLGVTAETLVGLTDKYLGVAMNPESTQDELDAVVESIAADISASLPDGAPKFTTAPDTEPENPFGGLKLRG